MKNFNYITFFISFNITASRLFISPYKNAKNVYNLYHLIFHYIMIDLIIFFLFPKHYYVSLDHLQSSFPLFYIYFDKNYHHSKFPYNNISIIFFPISYCNYLNHFSLMIQCCLLLLTLFLFLNLSINFFINVFWIINIQFLKNMNNIINYRNIF